LRAISDCADRLEHNDSQVQLRKLCTYHLMLAELHLECPHTYSATFGARTEFLTENKRIMAYLGHYKAVAKYAIDLQNSAAKRYLIQHTLYQLLDIFADPEHRALSAIYFLPIYQDELFILSLKDTLETAHASLEKHISHMELRLIDDMMLAPLLALIDRRLEMQEGFYSQVGSLKGVTGQGLGWDAKNLVSNLTSIAMHTLADKIMPLIVQKEVKIYRC
jgi:hypothetical protein